MPRTSSSDLAMARIDEPVDPAVGMPRRSAATAGIAWTMSRAPEPDDEDLHVRAARVAHAREQLARGVVLRVADDRGPPAVGRDDPRSGTDSTV